ncbi:MAG: hypothetical protein ACK5JH_02375 [Anaerocolumna sp.]
MSCNNYNNGYSNAQRGESFEEHIRKYVGETVIVFTESGGISGCGFTGVLLSVNCDFIRIDSRQGMAPSCPLGSSCCGDLNNDSNDSNNCNNNRKRNHYNVGSVCDIPVDSIVAFCHNAV